MKAIQKARSLDKKFNSLNNKIIDILLFFLFNAFIFVFFTSYFSLYLEISILEAVPIGFYVAMIFNCLYVMDTLKLKVF